MFEVVGAGSGDLNLYLAKPMEIQPIVLINGNILSFLGKVIHVVGASAFLRGTLTLILVALGISSAL